MCGDGRGRREREEGLADTEGDEAFKVLDCVVGGAWGVEEGGEGCEGH